MDLHISVWKSLQKKAADFQKDSYACVQMLFFWKTNISHHANSMLWRIIASKSSLSIWCFRLHPNSAPWWLCLPVMGEFLMWILIAAHFCSTWRGLASVLIHDLFMVRRCVILVLRLLRALNWHLEMNNADSHVRPPAPSCYSCIYTNCCSCIYSCNLELILETTLVTSDQDAYIKLNWSDVSYHVWSPEPHYFTCRILHVVTTV